MNHIDLFSGIGGFSFAAKRVWGKDYHNVLFCDNNKFCQEVIKKNFGKESIIYGDIREIIADAEKPRTGKDKQGLWCLLDGYFNGEEKIDLLTGGFPCQPFSQAGKRRGTTDDRYLWPEMLKIIQIFKPTWIVAENVRGILTIEQGMVFKQMCLDLESESYEIQSFIIPAVAVNAPHKRDRIWIVANSRRKHGERATQTREIKRALRSKKTSAKFKQPNTNKNFEWEQEWLEIATEFCGMDDGVSIELDGFKLTKARHRIERLKALGNAIVPQVSIQIMEAIKQAERLIKEKGVL